MRTLRRGLSWMAGAWLICQVSALAAAPIALAAVTCGCPLAGLGAACPMHRAATDAHECSLKNADAAPSAQLLSLMVGLIPPPLPAAAIAATAEAVPAPLASIDSRSDRPDSPPPRAVRLPTLRS
jgi:hypothetical protein